MPFISYLPSEKDMLVVETTARFDDELVIILDFIAEDSSERALDFYDGLLEKLHDIPSNPYMYRKRESMDEDTRELIYKGYTVPLYIDKEKNIVFILGIFNQNLWE